MKNFIKLIVVVILTTCGISCSSDDNSTDDKKEEKQLVLKADKLEVKVGDTVNFSAELDNKKIDGVKILINDQPATLKHIFKEAGTFKVVATKAGFKNSNPITIVVTASENKIVLKADKSTVAVGDKVTFSAQAAGSDLKDFKVSFSDGTEIIGTVWEAEKEGSFKFFATKDGLEKSDFVEITVTAKPLDLKLTLVTNPSEIYAQKPFSFSIVSENKPIKGAQLYVNGEALDVFSDEEGEFHLLGPAGTVTFTAEYNGSFSNGVEVTVQEAETVEATGEGSFEFNGSRYQIESSFLVFIGLEFADDEQREVVSRWQIEVNSEDYAAIYVFSTPTEKVAENTYNIVYPTATNTTPFIAGVLSKSGLAGVSDTDMEFKFNATLNEKQLFEGDYYGSTALMNNFPFSIQYQGETRFFDDTENRNNNVRSVSRFMSTNKKVTSSKIGRSVKELRSYVK